MRQGRGDAGDARREVGHAAKQFDVHFGPGNAPRRQALLEIFEKPRWTAQIELSVLRNPEFVEQLERKMAWSIEVLAERVSRRVAASGARGNARITAAVRPDQERDLNVRW